MTHNTQYNMIYDLNTIVDFNRIDDDEYITSLNLTKSVKDENNIIIKYNKSKLNPSNLLTTGLFRSIVVQKINDVYKVVSFAPPKSLNIQNELFTQTNNVVYQEFIEGTMINVYFDVIKNDWEITTRTIIGGKNKFFKDSLTFRDMFLEAMNESKLDFDNLNKSLCYSFVVQHPKNRIVLKAPKPLLYLCAIYECKDNQIYEHNIYDSGMGQFVYMPYCYGDKYTFETAKQIFASNITPFYCLGVVIKHRNGMRTKLRNPNYEYVRSLRGNQPKSQFQYLNLRNCGKVHEFLKFYPDFADEFNKYRSQVHQFTNNLHTFYLNCYASKEKPLGEYPYEFRTHMYQLHQKYINECIPNNQKITRDVVINYINTLPPARLMYSLNYKHREMNKYEKIYEKQQTMAE